MMQLYSHHVNDNTIAVDEHRTTPPNRHQK